MSERTCLEWHLLPGDRVVHYQMIGGSYPEGTISRVDPEACFFPYWVDWDTRWKGDLPEGAFQTSCFYFAEMSRRGYQPEMTEERRQQLIELQRKKIDAAMVRAMQDD